MIHRELRLALICYGGVSLAVYMHGITREVWSLVRASRDRAAGDPPASPLAAAYRDLLQELETRAGLRLRIINDIVAGASAGGLNGVFLARAIVTGQPLEPLTRLWLDSADVETLMSEDARPISRFTKVWAEPIAWYVARRRGGTVDRTVADEAKEEVGAKLSQFVRARWFSPPFGGETFSHLILDALGAMGAAPAGPPLLPPGQPLDLFVTATDFHGRPQRLALHSPPYVEEREHRLVFGFRDTGGGTLGSDAALALAGRATASFPGAFPPATVAELDRVLAARGQDWPEREADLRQLLPRRYESGTVEQAVMIDGSVLTNAPFGSALGALRNRPAKRPVDRRFVYLDPAPGHGSRIGREGEDGALPGFFGTVFGALSTIPRQQPIRDNLEAIAARTARVERVRRIVDALEPEVSAQVDEAIGRPFFFDRPSGDRLTKWSRMVAQRVSAKAGVALVGYRELRLSQLCEDMAATLVPDTTDPAGAAALIQRLWAHIHAEPGDGTEALETLDVLFRSRRLRRLARTVATLLTGGEVEAARLEPVRHIVFDALNRLQASAEATRACGLLGGLLASDAPVERLIERWAQVRDLPAFDTATAEALAVAIATLPEEIRRRLLRDWLGFSALDLATLPLSGGERLDEFDVVKVDRISPQDATTLRDASQATLKGVEFNHFGAFFSRRYRENDYLWGRLHGAERMVDLVLSTLSAADRPPDDWTVAAKARLFRAILDEERGRLDEVPDLIAALDGEVERLLAKGAQAD